MEVSISQVKCFKSCRKAYYFKYIEQLEPIEKALALEIGSNYHQILEDINKNGIKALENYPKTKELAMAQAYALYIYPHFTVKAAEEWVRYKLNDKHTLIGKVDGLSTDGCLVEHKTTSGEITEQYEYNLLWDEQILAYMLATGTRKVYYTVCRKPTIRQKKDETEEEFYYRILEWYAVDTESKIRLLEITRTDEEVEQFKAELEAICYEMESAEISDKNRVVSASPFYKNTCNCNAWGRRCEYSSICLNYDPSQEYIEFERKERRKE